MNNDPEALLAIYDRFMSGAEMSVDDIATVNKIGKAACFAAEAYQNGMDGGQAVHALLRSFLCALIDPMHPDLDYLRAAPASGPDMRGRN